MNEKLQGEMDTLNSEFDEVLKADDSKVFCCSFDNKLG